MNREEGLPRPTREHVLRAVMELETGGPVAVGDIARHVAAVLGVDLAQVPTVYELRAHLSWQSLQTVLRRLAEEGNLVRRTEQDWARVSRGLLFPNRPTSAWRYCTPQGAVSVRDAVRGSDGTLVRRVLAEQHAARALAALHPVEYAELVDQWLRDHPVQEQGAVA